MIVFFLLLLLLAGIVAGLRLFLKMEWITLVPLAITVAGVVFVIIGFSFVFYYAFFFFRYDENLEALLERYVKELFKK